MGLDGVELVMEMEERFGIAIDDRDAPTITTVGEAYRYILAKLGVKASATSCASASHFYRFRRALMNLSEIDRDRVRPTARVEDLLPIEGRRGAWLGLGDEMGLLMPGLELAGWQVGIARGAGLAAGISVLWVGATVQGGLGWHNLVGGLLVSGFVALIVWAEAYRSLLPFASEIPWGCENVRGLVGMLLGRPRLTLADEARRTWHPDEVWAALLDLISEQLGVPHDAITEDKSFVDDFGMD